MLRWAVPKLPAPCSRSDFIETVFDYGEVVEESCDILLTAVEIGDRFVHSLNEITPHVLQLHPILHKSEETMNLASAPVPRVYSEELAHVVVSLACKAFGEDFNLKDSVVGLENNYMFKMEWEVWASFEYHLPHQNFFTVISNLFTTVATYDGKKHLDTSFSRLARAMAHDGTMMSISPATILLACKLLHRRKQLRPQSEARQIFLIQLFMSLAHNYEVSMHAIIRKYIEVQGGCCIQTTHQSPEIIDLDALVMAEMQEPISI